MSTDWGLEEDNVQDSTQAVAWYQPPMLVEDALYELERFDDPYPISGDHLTRWEREKREDGRRKESIKNAAFAEFRGYQGLSFDEIAEREGWKQVAQ